MKARTRIITRPVVILSLVSLFTDISSEMLYPVMPLFLKSIGFSVLMIGLLEGLAEATAGLSKGYFGQLSDKLGRRMPFVLLGYTLSAISKPLMAVFAQAWWVFFARTTDRLGKGIRTGARDAYLSDCTVPEHKGKVFGFHRALDTLGAAIGPCIALLFLIAYPEHYKALFIIAFAPGLISILLTFFLKEKRKQQDMEVKKISFLTFLKYVKTSSREYRMLIGGLLAFTLFNSSDLFLLLMMQQAGLADTMLITVYIFYNLVYAVFAYPAGALGDRIGLKNTLILGIVLFVVVYTGMAIVTSTWLFFGLFLLYGIYAACTESIAKAWITNICSKQETGTAIGTFTAFNSVFSMISSALAGVIWVVFSPQAAFITAAGAAVIIIIYFVFLVPYTKVINK